MPALKWLAALTLAGSFLPVLDAEPHCPGNVAILRFRLVQGSQIVVPVTISHAGPYDFLVDTEDEISIVDPGLAADLHLKPEGTTGLVGVGYHTHPSYAHLDLLEAGSHAVENPLVLVQGLGELKAADSRIRGVLGGNFLRHSDVLIDYAQGVLCLDHTKGMQREVKGRHVALVTPPRSGEEGLSTEPLIITVQLSGIPGRSLLQLLDSGMSVPLLYEAGKEVAGGFSVHAPIHARGPDGSERVFVVLAPQEIKIGGVALHQVSFVTLAEGGKDVPRVGVDGLLPTSLFRRVYISYSDRFVVLEPW